jgi:hypothetical protein
LDLWACATPGWNIFLLVKKKDAKKNTDLGYRFD